MEEQQTFAERRPREVIARLVEWAQREELVRALVLTSSQVGTSSSRDRFSDYDLVVVVSDLPRFLANDAWLDRYGTPLVRFSDQNSVHGFEEHMRLVLYDDGVKVDYTVWPVELFMRARDEPALPDNLDVGYRVLVDKDELTSALKPATYTAHIPVKPSEHEYRDLIEEFWWESTYVAKNLIPFHSAPQNLHYR